jgi:hypothetical protein
MWTGNYASMLKKDKQFMEFFNGFFHSNEEIKQDPLLKKFIEVASQDSREELPPIVDPKDIDILNIDPAIIAFQVLSQFLPNNTPILCCKFSFQTCIR